MTNSNYDRFFLRLLTDAERQACCNDKIKYAVAEIAHDASEIESVAWRQHKGGAMAHLWALLIDGTAKTLCSDIQIELMMVDKKDFRPTRDISAICSACVINSDKKDIRLPRISDEI